MNVIRVSYIFLVICSCFCCGLGQETTSNSTESEKPNEDKLSQSPSVNNSTAIPIRTTEPTISHIIYEGKVLVCPDDDVRKPWFPLPCKVHQNCNLFDSKYLCCNSKCLKGVPPPNPEPIHKKFFGIIEQQCPTEPLAEIFAIKKCKSDRDCTPRICCKEKGSVNNYCRAPVPKLDKLPYADDFLRPAKLFFSYLQCTPPPPLVLDIFSKPCQSSLDCFPNLCCHEDGQKFCRPPKRSVLALVAGITEKIGSQQIAKRLIERIT